MSKEDFKTRDKMEIKRCVACLMRLLIPMKVRGSYSEEVRKLIAERCLEKIEIGDSPYDNDIIIVDDYVYVDQQAVLRIVSDDVKRKDIIIKAMPLNEDWILEEVLP